MPANDDDDLPGGEATEGTKSTSRPPQSGKSATSPAPAAVSPPTPPAAPKANAKPANLLKLAASYGIPQAVIDETTEDALRQLIHDCQDSIDRELKSRVGQVPQKTTASAQEPAPKPTRLVREKFEKYEPEVQELVDLTNHQAEMIEEMRAKLSKVDDLEKAETTRAARTIEGYLDDAFDALPASFRARFGEGSIADLPDGPHKEARLMIFRAAGIDVTKDNSRMMKQKIAAAVKALLGDGAVAAAGGGNPAGGYAAEAKGKNVAEEWAANALTPPTNRNGAPEVKKPSMAGARAAENEWRQRKGLPQMRVEDDDDSDLPE